MKACTIVFAGRRDNYEVARAFRDAGWRTTLVTDFVTPYWTQSIPLPKRLASAIERRKVTDLDGIEVVVPPLVAVERAFNRIVSRETSIWCAEHLGRIAARVVNMRGGLLLSYSTYGYSAFPKLRDGVRRILFQMHPHADTCVQIIEAASGMRRGQAEISEWEFRMPEHSFELYRREWAGAEGILAASTFTKETLVTAGAPTNRVRVVPYGTIDQPDFCGPTKISGPLRLLFVGSFIRRKGALKLARLAERFGRNQVEVHACGRGLAEPEVLAEFHRTGVVMHWNATDAEVGVLRSQCDAFVFPSYLEGFGHVILESLVAGLPVISTDRTCARDLIVDGKHGWILPAGDFGALESVVRHCLANRESVRAMREPSRRRGLEFTWQRFRRGVISATEDLLAN